MGVAAITVAVTRYVRAASSEGAPNNPPHSPENDPSLKLLGPKCTRHCDGSPTPRMNLESPERRISCPAMI